MAVHAIVVHAHRPFPILGSYPDLYLDTPLVKRAAKASQDCIRFLFLRPIPKI